MQSRYAGRSRSRAIAGYRPTAAAALVALAGLAGCTGPAAPSPPATASDASLGARSAAYPSSAGAALVASATWVTRSGVRSLAVVPSAAGRTPDADAAQLWSEVLRLRPDADTPGMRDQLICHLRFAPAKAAWFLEPARPAVGYAATVAAGCNPGKDIPDGG